MEIKSDIGNAMGNLTDTEWKLTKNEFDFVIACCLMLCKVLKYCSSSLACLSSSLTITSPFFTWVLTGFTN
jgi:hypothetical protein